jgi:hypothetical protein
MTDVALLRERARMLRRVADGARSSSFDPWSEARRVLEHCRHDLNLPDSMRIEWHHLDGRWGEVSTDRPHVICLAHRLKAHPDQLPDTVAHEAKHAQLILGGNPTFDDAAEAAATTYGRRVAAHWRYA